MIFRKFLSLVFGLLAIVWWIGPAMAETLPNDTESPVVRQNPFTLTPSPYTAEYIFRKAGVAVAYLTIDLSYDGKYWIYYSQARPYGVGSWFTKDTPEEVSRFRLIDGQLIPLSHRYKQTGSRDAKKSFSVVFINDGQSGSSTAQVRKAAGTKAYDLPTGIMDRQSVFIALMLHLQQKNPQTEYMVFDEDEIKNYRVELLGGETITTSLGQQTTTKVEHTAKNKTTRTWFAEDFSYVPVKVEQYKKGKLDFAMEINALKLPETSPQSTMQPVTQDNKLTSVD